jgi:chlorinating enzyme
MTVLTERELEGYRETGYLVPQYRLSPEQIQSLRDAVEHVIAANPGVRPEKLVNVHKAGRNPQGLMGDARFLELGRDPNLLDIVSDILGPDIILWGAQLMCKPVGESLKFPWHQDGAAWAIDPLATCTAWVALDDSCADNGCLRLIPGSHRERRLLQHESDESKDLVFPYKVAKAEFDEARAVDVELEAGRLVLFDVYMVHGSNHNRSRSRRAAIAYRYMPGTSCLDLSRFAPRPLWLVRGEDRTGRNDFRIYHDM